MKEPTLENIEDYDNLKGTKRKIVMSVIIAGLIIGAIYSIASTVFDNRKDTIHTDDVINVVPSGKTLPVR